MKITFGLLVLSILATTIFPQSAMAADCIANDSSCNLDIDKSGFIDQVDGQLVLRFLFGLTGAALVQGLNVYFGARTAQQMQQYLSNLNSHGLLDVNNDGEHGALSDGLLILRYVGGIRGAALVSGIPMPNANAYWVSYRLEALMLK